jgi:hypothetical protein
MVSGHHMYGWSLGTSTSSVWEEQTNPCVPQFFDMNFSCLICENGGIGERMFCGKYWKQLLFPEALSISLLVRDCRRSPSPVPFKYWLHPILRVLGYFWGHYHVQRPQISLVPYSYHGRPILFLGVVLRTRMHIVLSKKHHSPYDYLWSRTN